MRGTLHIDTGGIGREILNAFEGLSADFLKSSKAAFGDRTPVQALDYLKERAEERLKPFLKLAYKYWDVELGTVDLKYLPNGSGEMTKRLPTIQEPEARSIIAMWFAVRTISSLMNVLHMQGTMVAYTTLPSRRLNVDWEQSYDLIATVRLTDPFTIATSALCDVIHLLGYYPLETILRHDPQELIMYAVSGDYEFFGGYRPPSIMRGDDFKPRFTEYSNYLGQESDKLSSKRYLREIHRFTRELASGSNAPGVKIALSDIDPNGRGTSGTMPGVIRRRST